MKSNTFNYSLLAVGVAALMGVSTGAMAASPSTGGFENADVFAVSNVATAKYKVAGNSTEQEAKSNKVTVNVTESAWFSLIATSNDGVKDDDFNKDREILPTDNAVPNEFTHKLANTGNVKDTYTITLNNVAEEGVKGFDYKITEANIITYQVKDAAGADVGSAVKISSGGTITLEAGHYADITINAKANGERYIGQNGALTVTANSTYLTGANQPSSALNTDNAIVKTPTYAITKSATTNLGDKNLDFKNENAWVDYTITVKNDGTAKGTAVTIVDTLPAGLIAILPSQPNYVPPKVNGTASAGIISTDGKTITVTNRDIEIDTTTTITFRAKANTSLVQDEAGAWKATSNFVNFAVVKDDLNGDGTFDIIDSSGDKTDTNTTEKTFEDPNNPESHGKDNNTNATVSPSAQKRDITISEGTNKEVALKSEGNIYNYIITNKGIDITEADAPDEVYFTVKPETDNPEVTIDRVFVDANNNGVYDAGDTLLEADVTTGNYDLNDAVKGGLAPGDSVNIKVEVSTNGTSITGGKDDIDKSEKMIITILPKTIVQGTPAPTTIPTNSTTTMRGVSLSKYQAIAECGTAVTAIADGDWKKAETKGAPGQCIFYKLEATNTFSTASGVNVTGLILSDTLDKNIKYTANSAVANPTTAYSSQISEPLIQGTFDTLAPAAIATLKFSVKITQEGNATTTP